MCLKLILVYPKRFFYIFELFCYDKGYVHNIEEGVGLAFVRLVIKTIGEKISVDCEESKRTTFYIICLSTLVRVFKIVYN